VEEGMKLKTPIYLIYGFLLCGYLAVASRNGYSLLNTMTPGFLRSSGPSLQHK
jgi:hypothetical protein